MAGPNDVGVLRGIIGDGTSMNDEDMRSKIVGRRPGTTEKKDLLKFPPEKQQFSPKLGGQFSADKALDYFTGKNKSHTSPVESMKYFTGQHKQSVSPTAAIDYFTGRNNIRVDKFSRNALTEEQKTATAKRAAKEIKEKSLGKPKPVFTIYSKSAVPKDEETKKELLKANAQAILAKRQQETAEAQAAVATLEEAGKPPMNKNWRLQRVETGTLKLPEIFTSATKRTTPEGETNRLAGARDIWDTVKGAAGIIHGTEKVNAGIVPSTRTAEILLPTNYGLTTGLKDFAAGIAENLGPKIASGNVLIGPFEPQGGTQQIRNAQAAYAAYMQTLHKRHKTKGDASLLQAKASEAERLKLEKLRGSISLRQQEIASRGFMGGQGGAAMLMSNVPRGPVNRFTELGGAFTRQSYGNYGPEAMAQMGVGQGLRADQPNKWGVLLGQNAGTAKITQILGKKPDPLGESQAQKIQKLAVPMQSGEEAAAKIKRLSGM